MDDSLALPAGLTTRPLSFDDIDALANACELHDAGYTMWERGDLASDFRIDGLDPTVDTMGVAQDDRLIAWGFLPSDRSARAGRASGGARPRDRNLVAPMDPGSRQGTRIRSRRALVLAVDGQEVVGGALLIDSDEIWVDKFAVRRDHRDRGIARALMHVAFQRGFNRGYALDLALDRLGSERADVLREDRDARARVLHALFDRPFLAVAAGFEPARELPPYTLSRRAP
jgi:ribosomal protein S18 acetylase RimI-like enzyme